MGVQHQFYQIMGVQHQLVIKNSFIDFADESEKVQSPRPRSLSEYSGLCKLLAMPPVYDDTMAQDMDDDLDDRTTIMMRDIPNSYCTDRLVELFDSAGFSRRYDFVYLPMDFRTGMSLGYAFVDFVSNADAQRFMEVFAGFSSWMTPSPKVCQISWADPNQGLAAHVEKYRNSPVMHENIPDGYKPRLYNQGMRVPFPPPTKRIRAPRVRPAKRSSADRSLGYPSQVHCQTCMPHCFMDSLSMYSQMA
jgi:RNA recognition motif-containing protein